MRNIFTILDSDECRDIINNCRLLLYEAMGKDRVLVHYLDRDGSNSGIALLSDWRKASVGAL